MSYHKLKHIGIWKVGCSVLPAGAAQRLGFLQHAGAASIKVKLGQLDGSGTAIYM